jgi:hypothetical protein
VPVRREGQGRRLVRRYISGFGGVIAGHKPASRHAHEKTEG